MVMYFSPAGIFLSGEEESLREGNCSTDVYLANLTYSSLRKQRCTDDDARQIRCQIIHARLPTRQIHLMIFVQHTDQQCSSSSDYQHSLSLKPARQTNSPGEQSKKPTMDQFIPWRRYQLDRKRLCSKHEQAEYDSGRQQNGCDA